MTAATACVSTAAGKPTTNWPTWHCRASCSRAVLLRPGTLDRRWLTVWTAESANGSIRQNGVLWCDAGSRWQKSIKTCPRPTVVYRIAWQCLLACCRCVCAIWRLESLTDTRRRGWGLRSLSTDDSCVLRRYRPARPVSTVFTGSKPDDLFVGFERTASRRSIDVYWRWRLAKYCDTPGAEPSCCDCYVKGYLARGGEDKF